MGLFGNNDARVIKDADNDARSQNNKPTMHGSKSEWTLMSGLGGAINWSPNSGADFHVGVTGEGPGKQR